MCRFIETIRIENGRICNPEYHNRRMNETRKTFFHEVLALDVKDFISPGSEARRLKCRMEYAEQILNVVITPYYMRPVASLLLMENDILDYTFKYADRRELNRMFALKKEAADILIVRDGFLTDTSIANVALYNGSEWITPSKPLLRGTKRAELLEKGKIREEDIPFSGVYSFTHIALFNAMIDFGELVFPVNKQTILHAL